MQPFSKPCCRVNITNQKVFASQESFTALLQNQKCVLIFKQMISSVVEKQDNDLRIYFEIVRLKEKLVEELWTWNWLRALELFSSLDTQCSNKWSQHWNKELFRGYYTVYFEIVRLKENLIEEFKLVERFGDVQQFGHLSLDAVDDEEDKCLNKMTRKVGNYNIYQFQLAVKRSFHESVTSFEDSYNMERIFLNV